MILRLAFLSVHPLLDFLCVVVVSALGCNHLILDDLRCVIVIVGCCYGAQLRMSPGTYICVLFICKTWQPASETGEPSVAQPQKSQVWGWKWTSAEEQLPSLARLNLIPTSAKTKPTPTSPNKQTNQLSENKAYREIPSFGWLRQNLWSQPDLKGRKAWFLPLTQGVTYRSMGKAAGAGVGGWHFWLLTTSHIWVTPFVPLTASQTKTA